MPVVADIPKTYRTFAQSQPYSIRAFWDFTAGSTASAALQPKGESREHLLVATKLGRSGLHRIHQFRTYGPGWDFGSGAPMSEASYRNLCAFLANLKLSDDIKPSVFLNADGHLELAWEKAGAVQVEFGPNEITFFSDGAEESVSSASAASLATALSG